MLHGYVCSVLTGFPHTQASVEYYRNIQYQRTLFPTIMQLIFACNWCLHANRGTRFGKSNEKLNFLAIKYIPIFLYHDQLVLRYSNNKVKILYLTRMKIKFHSLATHLVYIGMPHLCEEPDSWWVVRIIIRELHQCLENKIQLTSHIASMFGHIILA